MFVCVSDCRLSFVYFCSENIFYEVEKCLFMNETKTNKNFLAKFGNSSFSLKSFIWNYCGIFYASLYFFSTFFYDPQ